MSSINCRSTGTRSARMLINPEFRSLCEDYGDASDALHRWEGFSDSHRAARVKEFRRLPGELKTKILTELEAT